MKRLLLGLLATAAIFAATQPANAALLGNDLQDWNLAGAAVLELKPVVPDGNQPQNLPCIICGANQPQQPATFGYNLFGNTGNATTLPFFSTSVVGGSLLPDQFGGVNSGYTINAGSPFLTALQGKVGFSIGLDANQAGKASQTLESFWFLNFTTHQVLGVYSPGPGGDLIDPVNNGTGFPDFLITGLTLAGVNPNDRIGFFARITGANDGPDSFFLVPGGTLAETPVPGAVWLFGTILAMIGGIKTIRDRNLRRRPVRSAARLATA